MLINIFFLIIGIAFSMRFIIKRTPDVTKQDVINKGLASAFFVITGITTYGIVHTTFVLLFCLGLIMGFCGDIVLDYKYCCKKENSNNFLLIGFASFATGHLCYTCALNLKNTEWYFWAIPILVAIITEIAVLILEKPMELNYENEKLVVLVYSGILTLPLTTSICNFIKEPNVVNALFIIAFASFLASDFILSGIYFGNKNNKKNIAACHILYYAAQYLIVIATALAYYPSFN